MLKFNQDHRRMSQWGCSPPDLGTPDSGETVIFRAKAKFFGHKPAANK